MISKNFNGSGSAPTALKSLGFRPLAEAILTSGAYLERVQGVPQTRGFLEIDKSYLVKHPKFGNYTKVEPVTKNS